VVNTSLKTVQADLTAQNKNYNIIEIYFKLKANRILRVD
jgi:hypothetical protein